jgi:hypothetical protein
MDSQVDKEVWPCPCDSTPVMAIRIDVETRMVLDFVMRSRGGEGDADS